MTRSFMAASNTSLPSRDRKWEKRAAGWPHPPLGSAELENSFQSTRAYEGSVCVGVGGREEQVQYLYVGCVPICVQCVCVVCVCSVCVVYV